MSAADLFVASSGALNFGGLIVNVLAVLGGAAVGFFGSGWVVQLIARFAVRRKVPPWALAVIRVLGAVLGGWLVALIVFGSGGWGLGSGGWGFGGSGGAGGREGLGTGAAVTARQADDKDKGKSPGDTPPPPQDGALRVEVLGDERVRDDRFYRVEGETELRDLAGLRRTIGERRRQEPPVRRVVLVIYENSPDRNHPVVRAVERWAKENDLEVSFHEPKGKAP